MTNLQQVATEVRERIQTLEGSTEEKRDSVMKDLIGTYRITELSLFQYIAQHPDNGFNFIMKVQKSLGAVNEVMANEFGMEPVHIKDLDLAIVDTFEDITGKHIDTLIQEALDNLH